MVIEILSTVKTLFLEVITDLKNAKTCCPESDLGSFILMHVILEFNHDVSC